MRGETRRGLAVLLAAFLVFSTVAVPAAATNDTRNWDAAASDDPYIYESTLTVAEHNASEMSSPLDYYDDSGNVDSLPATLNESIDNPVGVRADLIDTENYREFPRKSDEPNGNDASALDHSEWGKDMAGSAGSGSITDTTVDGIEAVTFSTSGQTSSDVANFSYGNFSITTDATKRVPLAVLNVESLDAGATVLLKFAQNDGDYVTANISSGATASSADVIANATGNGYLWQERLADLTVYGSGDGTLDAVHRVDVVVQDANAKVTLVGLDAERKSALDLGTTLEDTDSDSANESVTVSEVYQGGYQRLTGLDTLPSEFSSATVHDLEVHGVEYRASEAPGSDIFHNYTAADDYPNFAEILDAHHRLEVPAAIDLTHSGMELRMDQAMVSGRYVTLEYAEGTADKDPADVSSWSAISVGNKGQLLVPDTTIQSGQEIMVHVEKKLTNSEADALRQAGGAGGGPVGGGGGGLLGMILSPFGILAGLVTAFVGNALRG